ncbi:MAG TPA: sigma-70 family RNA polymerase sigma factor [Pyrinomonadaceae bacterium]|jgi:RNA polymerase sigma factor (sigma-70 family)
MIWPPLQSSYTDEFGPMAPEVYRVAGEIWAGWGEAFALRTLRDEHAGMPLMLKSVAEVSRVRAANIDHIGNLKGYLSTTYKRLVLERLEKENGHRHRDRQLLDLSSPTSDEADLDRKILIQQLIRRFDPWTRRVFELLALGYTYEEIAPSIGMQANAVRSRYHKSIVKLKKQLDGESDG